MTGRRLRVVVADDELDMRDYFKRMLPLLGYEVAAVAATGEELVQACRVHAPDLVITDIKMPDLDGLDALAEICAERPVPIVVVSGHADPDRIALAYEGPVCAYMVKPIKRAQLAAAIENALDRFGRL